MNLVCDLFVDGQFEGTIESHKQITIGKNGKVMGEMHAHRIIVHGVVEGTVDAERVEIKESGHVKGSLISSELVIEAKGAFEGESKIKGGDAPAAKPTPKLTSETVQKIKENIEAS
jgi:cytoskeletal protein CcmA (bactofilin family)